MSRIGKKPIAIPKGVTVKIEGNTVMVQGPKGKLDTPLPSGITMEQKDGNLVAIRPDDAHAAVHGLARALVNNAVEGVTKGWKRDLEIVGIGYRAEMKGKGLVVFSLGSEIEIGKRRARGGFNGLAIMLFGESEILAVVIKRTQIDMRSRVGSLDFEHLMIRGNGLRLSVGILFEGDASREPCRSFVLAGTGLGLWHGRGGQDFLALGKIHQELTCDRLQQPALVAESHAVLRRRGSTGLEQGFLHARSLLAHGIERLANHRRTDAHGAQVANLFDFQEIGKRIGFGRRYQAHPLPIE